MPIRRPVKAPQTRIGDSNNRLSSCECTALNDHFVVFPVPPHVGEPAPVGRPGQVVEAVSCPGSKYFACLSATSRHHPNAVPIDESDASSIRRWHRDVSIVSQPDEGSAFRPKTPNARRVVGPRISAYQKLGSVPEPCELDSTKAHAFGDWHRLSLARFHSPQMQTF